MCLVLVACAEDKVKPTAEELQAQAEARIAKIEALELSLFEASDNKLKELLSDCRLKIKAYVDRTNSGPYATHLVDEYSADVYQLQAGRSATETDEQRIRGLRNSEDFFYFNTTYPVLTAKDSFNGPLKEVKKYSCEFDEGPVVASVRYSPI